jgi:hypothetical protein
VPLKLLCEKFAHTRFEPSGWSGNPEIGYAKSIMDYIFRWLQMRFLTGQQQTAVRKLPAADRGPWTSGLGNWKPGRGAYPASGGGDAGAGSRIHSRRRRALKHRRHGRRA